MEIDLFPARQCLGSHQRKSSQVSHSEIRILNHVTQYQYQTARDHGIRIYGSVESTSRRAIMEDLYERRCSVDLSDVNVYAENRNPFV